eukprot:3121343-Amphidinium_carterae.1
MSLRGGGVRVIPARAFRSLYACQGWCVMAVAMEEQRSSIQSCLSDLISFRAMLKTFCICDFNNSPVNTGSWWLIKPKSSRSAKILWSVEVRSSAGLPRCWCQADDRRLSLLSWVSVYKVRSLSHGLRGMRTCLGAVL